MKYICEMKSKKKIPKALKEQVWLTYNGPQFACKCHIAWCKNVITPFTFETGHNIPESKGGTLDIANLRPICSKCNKSMGDEYTIDEFSRISKAHTVNRGLFSCFRSNRVESSY
jgi:5-methylcytosine-specific restriction endonuclease McrA